MLALIFILSFVVVGFIYSVLAAFTGILYKNKPLSELSRPEREILDGKATIWTKLGIFLLSLISISISPPPYIIAGVATLLVYLATSYGFGGGIGIFITITIAVFLGWKFLIRQGTGHIKLHNLKFVNIEKNGDEYVYIYVVSAKLNFKNKYLKMLFTSRLPDYMWTEIQKAMAKNCIYFEDLTEGEPQNIKIGSIAYSYFSDADFKKYSTNIKQWQSFLKKAVDKQRTFVEKEMKKNPDRSKLYEIYDL